MSNALKALLLATAPLLSPATAAADETPAPLDEFDVDSQRVSGFPIRSLTQTRDGFVWLNVTNEVYRMDGAHIEHLNKVFVDFPVKQDMTPLAPAPDGSLWMGFDEPVDGVKPVAPLAVYRAGQRRWIGPQQGLTASRVTTLAVDRNGWVWVGAPEGLFRVPAAPGFRPSEIVRWQTPPVRSLLVTRRGDVLIGTVAGLSRLPSGGTTIAAEPIEGPIAALAAGPQDDSLWAATTDTVTLIENHQVGKRLGKNEGLAAGPIRALLADAHGDLWVGADKGLSRLHNGSLTTLTTGNGLEDGSVSVLHQDDQGTIWIGTQSGWVTRFRPKTLWNLGAPEGVPGDEIFAVFQARDESIWISSADGVSRWRHGMLEAFRSGDRFPGREPRSLTETADGAIWIATLDAGPVRFKNGVFQIVDIPGGAPEHGAHLVFADRAGDLWIGWRDGGVTHARVAPDRGTRPRIETLRTFTRQDGLCPTAVITAADRAAGGVWLGTEVGGLALVDAGTGRCFSTRDGLPATPITALTEDRDGALWFGLALDKGLVRLRDGKFVRLDETNGLYCDNVLGLLDDDRGHLWTTCGKGIARFEKSELNAFADGRAARVQSSIHLETQHGMRSRPMMTGAQPAMMLARDGAFWVATPLGVTVLRDPGVRPAGPRPPAIEEVRVDGHAVVFDEAVTATTDHATLEFRFTEPTSGAVEDVLYRYHLTGFDPTGLVRTSDGVAHYRNVLPGDYVFKVAAVSDRWNATGADATVRLHLVPVFYRTRPFFAACLAFLILAAAAVYRVRVRQVAARYESIRQERVRIARDLHDGLGQGFTALAFHVEAMHELLRSGGDMRNLLAQTSDLVQQCHEEARRSIWNLRAADVDAAVFTEQVEAAIRKLVAGSGKRVPRLHFESKGRVFPESGMLRHEVQHIVEEAVANALAHGAPGEITVAFDIDEHHIGVRVEDDGKGFDPEVDAGRAVDRGHFGLLGMQERSRRLGGSLSVQSAPGQGTRIELNVPQDSAHRGVA